MADTAIGGLPTASAIVGADYLVIVHAGVDYKIPWSSILLNTIATGTVAMFAGSVAPTGWLLCDGSSYARVGTYANLFAVIGTNFGAVDGSHFNVPDMRGRVPVGVGTGAGGGASGTTGTDPAGGSALTARAIGAWFGEQLHTLITGELPAHNHVVTDPGHHHNRNTAGAVSSGNTGYLTRGNSASSPLNVQDTDNATTGITTQNTGSGTAHNIMQPSLCLNFIIQY